MGAAGETRLEQLRAAVRDRIGQPAHTLSHSCDVMVDEVCRFWPLKEFQRLADDQHGPATGGDVIRAMRVVVAKARENLEARWGLAKPTQNAIDLLMEAIVIELANIWFRSAESREAMADVIAAIRSSAADRKK